MTEEEIRTRACYSCGKRELRGNPNAHFIAGQFTCDDCYEDAHGTPLSPRGETPEQILNRLAARLNCEPRQVADRVIRMLEERKHGSV